MRTCNQIVLYLEKNTYVYSNMNQKQRKLNLYSFTTTFTRYVCKNNVSSHVLYKLNNCENHIGVDHQSSYYGCFS